MAYASEVKFDVLGVPEGPVVSEPAAAAMAEGARRVLGADVGLGITGVAGPTSRTACRPGPSSWACPGPGSPVRPSSCGSRATGTGSASWGPFRPSTCSDAALDAHNS